MDSPGGIDSEVTALRTRIKSLETTVNLLWVSFAAVLCIGMLVWTVATPHRPSGYVPPNRDDAESQLLQPGVHCYGNSDEMTTARQRALAAVDRYRWQNRIEAKLHPRDAMDVQMWGASPIHPEATLSIDKPSSISGDDPSRCFEVLGPPAGGLYLPPAAN